MTKLSTFFLTFILLCAVSVYLFSVICCYMFCVPCIEHPYWDNWTLGLVKSSLARCVITAWSFTLLSARDSHQQSHKVNLCMCNYSALWHEGASSVFNHIQDTFSWLYGLIDCGSAGGFFPLGRCFLTTVAFIAVGFSVWLWEELTSLWMWF